MTPRLHSERGIALVFVLIMLSVMTMIGLGITGIGMVATTVTMNAGETAGAMAIADAGLAHARRLILWQEWASPNVLLQNGAGVACDGDELADAPAGAPAGFPAGVADFIPQAGRAFGGGTYQVFICDDHATDLDPATGVLNADANVDVNRRIIVRSVGTSATGATATVEQIYSSVDLPAVIINGNVVATGNPHVMGAAGALHGNGSLEVAGNGCAQQYFSAGGGVNITGNSVGGGAGCTGAGLQTIPDSPPLNVPVLSADLYKAQADYWLNSNGTCYSVAIAANVLCGALGWNYNAGSSTWSDDPVILPGTYWVDGNADLNGNHGSALAAMPLTILAKGHVKIAGSPRTQPDLTVAGLGVNNVGVSIIAGTDIQLVGNTLQLVDSVYYAAHQLDVTGSPAITGQVIALNQADTPYPAAGGTNLVPLGADGRMEFSGSPTITFNGNGMQSLRAQQWRECRTSNDPANPCGTLFGG
jgi:hypothetical protein